MASKKGKNKNEEVTDLQDLPEWASMICRLNVLHKDANLQRQLTSVNKTQRNYLKFIKRNEIIEFAKEKGLYIDPATISPLH